MATGIRRLNDPAGIDEHGQPLPETIRDRMLRMTRRGLAPEVAAQACGIGFRAFTLWMQAGRSALTEIDADPQVELTEEARLSAEFATDIESSLGLWLNDANTILEAETRRRQIVTTKVTTDRAGEEIERTVVTREEPGDTGRLAWRMGKVSPVYGRERIELTGADGGPVEVDIGARLNQVIADIRATLTVERAETSNGNGLPRGLDEGDGAGLEG